MGSGELNGENTSKKKGETSSSAKCCADCKTTKTPLWRVGPSGPKSLCNACGIRYRKKRVSVGSPPPASSSPDRKRERQPPPPAQPHGSPPEGSDMGKGISESVRMSLFLVGNDLLIRGAKKQRCRRKRKLGEEELAAVSLMALSCGCVFA